MLAGAERPLVVVGGAPWSVEAHDALTAWCTESALPVASGWRRQDYVDNSSDAYVGHLALGADPRLAQRVRDADVLLVIGDRLSEITTAGYTLLGVPDPAQALIHVTADPDELGRVYTPALAVAASPDAFARALSALPPLEPGAREEGTRQGRQDYLDNLRCRPMPGDLDMGEVMATVRARLPADAIFTNGAGNFSVWAHRFYEFRDYPTQLAPTSGAMGYGVPAAVAAKLLHPERDVVAIAGDGDFLMTGQELATAVQYDAPIVVLIVNNGMFGTIRMHQERHYPGRVSGTDLVNPDFAALARGVRRARGGGRAHRGLRRRLRRGARRRTARGDRAARRPGGADAAAIADRDSRAGDRAALDTRRITHLRAQNPTREGALCMAKSYASTVIKASPDEVWARVRDFNGLADVAQRARLGRARSRTARPATRSASIRSFTLTDGTHIREQLLAHSDLDRSYTYDFQKTPFDVDNYCATLRVTPLTDGGGSFVEWWTTFDCDRDQQGHWTDFFATRGVPGRLRRAQGALRLMGGARRSCASPVRPSRSRTSRTPSRRAGSSSSPASSPSTSGASSSAVTTSSPRRAACSRTCGPFSPPAAAPSPTSSR